MDLYLRWQQLWSFCNIQVSSDEWLRELQTHYREPQRAYHTLQHLAECLSYFDTVRSLLHHPVEVELALWFHDAIYDTHRSDNEAASAQWAQQVLLAVGAPQVTIQRVTNFIQLTKHVAEPVDEDGAYLLDIDLAILGADHERFAEYEQQVRQEYAWVAWPAFCAGRAKLLQAFLQRPTIYRTEVFQKRFETQARTNLGASLANLQQAAATDHANQS